jgi:hypothetical protein
MATIFFSLIEIHTVVVLLIPICTQVQRGSVRERAIKFEEEKEIIKWRLIQYIDDVSSNERKSRRQLKDGDN